jgi:hypothetical protein
MEPEFRAAVQLRSTESNTSLNLAEAGLWSDVLPASKGEVGHFSEKALVLMAAECWSVGFCHCQ